MPVRRAGTQGVVQSFFDELFNHLDPYSRYVPPRDAGEDRERRVGQAGAGLRLARRGSAHRGCGGHCRRSGRARGNSARRHDRFGGRPVDPRQGPRHRDGLDRRAGGDPAHACLARPRRRVRTRPSWNAPWCRPRPSSRSARRVAGDPDDRASTAAPTAISRRRSSRVSPAPVRREGIVLDLRGNRGGLLRQAVRRPTRCCPPVS